MRLTQYDVEIKYRRGPEMYLADTLSRAYLPQEHYPGKAHQEVERVHSVNFLSISEPQIQEIREETAKDPVLQTLKVTILNGWPSQRKKLPPELPSTSKSRTSWLHKMVLFSRVPNVSSRKV